MGLKLYDMIDDKFLFPLSLKVVDTPGTIMDSLPQREYAFSKPS